MSPRRTDDDEQRFRSFAAGASAPLVRLAYLLCGDRHLAEDLVQACLIRMYRSWQRIERPEALDGYARQVLLRCWLNERRRPWRRLESYPGTLPDQTDDNSDPALGVGSDVKELLRRALAEIPPRQRAALVLRYWSQCTVTETATMLRCSEGTVKSQTARGLTALRAAVTRLGGDAVLSRELSS